MAKLIVNCLSVSGRNNKIYRSGDEVTDKHFPQGRAMELLKSGKLRLAEGETFEEKKSSSNTQVVDMRPDEDTTTKTKVDPPSDDETKKDFEEITREEMITHLMNKNVSFKPELGNKKLYALYEKTFEEKK